MSPCHCQCQSDHYTVLQKKIHANNEHSCFCVQVRVGLGKSLECKPHRFIPYTNMNKYPCTAGSLVLSTEHMLL